MSSSTLHVRNFAQIREAKVSFGDLTLLIGPQATGKSLVLQLLKLAVDSTRIAGTLKQHGFHWSGREEFCSVYFGEGMSKVWSKRTSVTFAGKTVVPPVKTTQDDQHLFYIPAHRTLSVAEGWPAGFRSYRPDTPYVVRDFSEKLLDLLNTQKIKGDIFPANRRLKKPFRNIIDSAVFHGGRLKLVSEGLRRQFKLVYPGSEIAYMAWTAGQREFIPLLLGIYHLVPLGAVPKVESIRWIVIEEPEMGLHPNGVIAVMLLILELMGRGYRVVLSTHSPTVAEIVWGIQELQAKGSKPASVAKLFDVKKARWDIDELARKILGMNYQVFHFDYEGKEVTAEAIQRLDPASPNRRERFWGGLTALSARVNEVVAEG